MCPTAEQSIFFGKILKMDAVKAADPQSGWNPKLAFAVLKNSINLRLHQPVIHGKSLPGELLRK